MTIQKQFSAPQSADYAFRRRYCRHKVWVAMKKGRNKTFYAKDCSATYLQIGCKKVHEVLLDQQASLADCRSIEKYFRGQYATVLIYRRLPNGQWPDKNGYLMKYVDGNLVEESTEPLPANIRCQVQWKDVGFELIPIAERLAPTAPVAPVPTCISANEPMAAFISDRAKAIATKWRIN